MKPGSIFITSLTICLLCGFHAALAQNPASRFRGMGAGGGAKGGDSLRHRNNAEDSITINFRFLDSSRLRKMDSTIYDFTNRIPLKATWRDLGNLGTPAHNLVFTPSMVSGWDPGYHALDLYVFTPEETKFYNTTRPYTELGYLLGSSNEQVIRVMQTQNIKPNWNATFEYRLINSLGTYSSQNTNHNNYRFSSWYQSPNKRYQNFFVIVGSKLQASENGGIDKVSDLDSNAFTNRLNVPVRIGATNTQLSGSFFTSGITTGTLYTQATYLVRQQYDVYGIKDSVVTDTTVVPLFYPKIRAEHTFSLSTYNYRFVDNAPQADYYQQQLHFITVPDTLKLRNYWREFLNDFSLYQFPDNKNPQQFFKAGISLQNLHGEFAAGSRSLYNLFVHGEYRNKTRNQKWDIEAFGKFYVNGFNAGDYDAYISLKRLLAKKIGYLELGFQNMNKTPSYAFDPTGSFSFGAQGNFNKTNITSLFASIEQPQLELKLTGRYFLVANYSYYADYYLAKQQSSLFNMLQVSAEKVFTLHRNWKWRAMAILQQKTGSAPVNVPLIYTRNQFGYEGRLGFTNLRIAFGVEARYFTPYKADGYSPVVGQFFVQNDSTIKEKLPDLSLYMHLRIRGFTLYVRGENINTAQVSANGFGFTNVNFSAPNYPLPGLQIRFGIFWGFID